MASKVLAASLLSLDPLKLPVLRRVHAIAYRFAGLLALLGCLSQAHARLLAEYESGALSVELKR